MKDVSRNNEDLLLIRWLYTQRPDLVRQSQAASDSNASSLKKAMQAAGLILYAILWANPRAFDGQSIVSSDSERHAMLTSGVVSGATLFNAITNGPILFQSFRYVGLAPALGISVLLNIIILWWTNQSGTAAANQKHGNKVWSGVGIAAFLAMSTVQSVVAGVGAELLNNQEELSYLHAEQLVNDEIKELKAIARPLKIEANKVKQNCESARENLEEMKAAEHPGYNNKFIEIYGVNNAQRINGYEGDTKAVCSSNNETVEKSLEAEQDVLDLEEQKATMGNPIELLRQREAEGGPKTYSKHFRNNPKEEIVGYTEDNEPIREMQSNYSLRSGTVAIALASENFWSNLPSLLPGQSREGKVGLNSSLLFFALSVITSLSAVVLIIAHTCTLDTKMSRNSKVEEAVKHWLESIRRQYAQRPEPERSQEDEKLLALFIDDYYQSGKCDYPVAQAVAKMSQKGVGLRLLRDGSTLIQEIDKAYEQVDKSSFELNAQLSQASEQTALDTETVKRSLAQLTQGVIRLLSLSDRYAASVSFEGEKTHYSIMKSLADQLRSQLDDIKMTLYNNLVRYGVEASTRDNALDDLRSYLVGLQGGCAELKELTQEAIRDKIIPIFGDRDIPPINEV